jgi:hypothetical protein
VILRSDGNLLNGLNYGWKKKVCSFNLTDMRNIIGQAVHANLPWSTQIGHRFVRRQTGKGLCVHE